MENQEYKNIFENENSYWWYKVLDDLVEYYVNIYSKNGSTKILDAGCGTGRMMYKLSRYGEVYGIDSSPTAIEFCKSKGLENVEIADLNLWGEDNKYNIILSLDVLYHKSISNVEKVLKAFNNSLKENGILILNVPAFTLLTRHHDKVVHGDKRFHKSELKQMLRNSGFSVFAISYRYIILFKIILLYKFIFRRKQKSSDLTPISTLLNKILWLIHRPENEIIKMGLQIPYGSSIFAVAVKSGISNSLLKTDRSHRNGLSSKFEIYLKSKTIFNQMLKYSFVGIFNTIIGLGLIYFLFNVLKINYIVSNIIGYACGLINSFIWNRRWTFKSSKHFSTEIIPFLIVFGISYFANLFTVILFVELFNVHPNVAQFLGMIAYSTSNFFINRYWTFSKAN